MLCFVAWASGNMADLAQYQTSRITIVIDADDEIFHRITSLS